MANFIKRLLYFFKLTNNSISIMKNYIYNYLYKKKTHENIKLYFN